MDGGNVGRNVNQDELMFFDGRLDALETYLALRRCISEMFPDVQLRVQKTQIAFFERFVFASVSLPRRKWDRGVMLTLGLAYRMDSPRAASASEPYPGRWTHHIPVAEPSELDSELAEWIREAYFFNQSKRSGRK